MEPKIVASSSQQSQRSEDANLMPRSCDCAEHVRRLLLSPVFVRLIFIDVRVGEPAVRRWRVTSHATSGKGGLQLARSFGDPQKCPQERDGLISTIGEGGRVTSPMGNGGLLGRGRGSTIARVRPDLIETPPSPLVGCANGIMGGMEPYIGKGFVNGFVVVCASPRIRDNVLGPQNMASFGSTTKSSQNNSLGYSSKKNTTTHGHVFAMAPQSTMAMIFVIPIYSST